LGAWTVNLQSYQHFPLENIIPTETDDFFRNEKLRGFVHDEGAAMLGGISGNAGLFGTTNDLAKVVSNVPSKRILWRQTVYFRRNLKRIYSQCSFPATVKTGGAGFRQTTD
jgi:hypothetical protein